MEHYIYISYKRWLQFNELELLILLITSTDPDPYYEPKK